jgi:hypothetical protein
MSFLVRHEHLAVTHVFHAIEVVDGPGGYTFAASDYDEATALAKMREEVARGLATRYLEPWESGPRIAGCWVAGEIRANGVVVDGRFFTPEEFQELLYWKQGSRFRMEIRDTTEPFEDARTT